MEMKKKVGIALSIVGEVFLIAPFALYFIMGESIPVILGGSSGTAQLLIIVALIPVPAISLGLSTFLIHKQERIENDDRIRTFSRY